MQGNPLIRFLHELATRMNEWPQGKRNAAGVDGLVWAVMGDNYEHAVCPVHVHCLLFSYSVANSNTVTTSDARHARTALQTTTRGTVMQAKT